LLQLDFRKAFDTVEWPVIQQTLSKFNFGDSIKRWVQTFPVMLRALFLTMMLTQNKYPCQEVLDKTAPCRHISLFWWLASKMKHHIQGIKLFKKEINLGQFADDTSFIRKNLMSTENVHTMLADFGVISSLTVE